jgi:SAM-dependent methyltransferase
MSDKAEERGFGDAYWDSIVSKSSGEDRQDLWRAHMKELYEGLTDRWRAKEKPGRILKTDLYEEAVSRHNLMPALACWCDHMVGTDLSFETARAAKQRMGDEWAGCRSIVVSDVRNQAFKSNAFDEILSNSTLDHFQDRKHILQSLGELRRILKPGGVLIITLDNPWNPVVFLRNRLPYRPLKRLGVIPYYMGVTCSRPQLIRALESEGFRVDDSTAIVHGPRIVAIHAGRLLDRIGRERSKASFLRLLRALEGLERLPTKYVTGHYVAVKAVKV